MASWKEMELAKYLLVPSELGTGDASSCYRSSKGPGGVCGVQVVGHATMSKTPLSAADRRWSRSARVAV